MSWSLQIPPVKKADFDSAVDNTAKPNYLNEDTPAIKAASVQVDVAKKIAKLLAPDIPGPYLSAYLSGHANGTGETIPNGMSSEAITVNVAQQPEPRPIHA